MSTLQALMRSPSIVKAMTGNDLVERARTRCHFQFYLFTLQATAAAAAVSAAPEWQKVDRGAHNRSQFEIKFRR